MHPDTNVKYTINISETILSTSDRAHSDFNYDNEYNADCESDHEYFTELYNKFREMK